MGEHCFGIAGADSRVVGRLTGINAPAPALAARAAAGLRRQLSPQIGQELLQGVETGAVAATDARGSLPAARVAVGLEAEPTPAPAKK